MKEERFFYFLVGAVLLTGVTVCITWLFFPRQVVSYKSGTTTVSQTKTVYLGSPLPTQPVLHGLAIARPMSGPIVPLATKELWGAIYVNMFIAGNRECVEAENQGDALWCWQLTGGS